MWNKFTCLQSDENFADCHVCGKASTDYQAKNLLPTWSTVVELLRRLPFLFLDMEESMLPKEKCILIPINKVWNGNLCRQSGKFVPKCKMIMTYKIPDRQPRKGLNSSGFLLWTGIIKITMCIEMKLHVLPTCDDWIFIQGVGKNPQRHMQEINQWEN